MADTDITI